MRFSHNTYAHNMEFIRYFFVDFFQQEWTMISISALVAASISFIAYPVYIVSIFRGKTVPHPFTWISLALLTGVTLFMFWASGGEDAGLMMAWDLVGTICIAGLSLFFWRKMDRNFDFSDKVTFSGALLGIGVYVIIKDPFFSLIVSLTVEALSIIPTIRKAYRHPEEESLFAWTLGLVGDSVNMMAIRTVVDTVYVFTAFFMDGLVWSILVGRRGKTKEITKKRHNASMVFLSQLMRREV